MGTDTQRQDVFQHFVKLLLARGKHQAVVEWSRRVFEQDSTRSDAVYYLAVGLRKRAQYDEAIQAYESYAELRPDDADPHYGLGMCHEALGNLGKAQIAYQAYLNKEHRPGFQRWKDRAKRVLTQTPATAGPVVSKAPVVAPQGSKPTAVATAKPRTPSQPTAVHQAPQTAVKQPAPVVKPAPVAAQRCDEHEKAVKKDPFDQAAYDKLAACLVAKGQHQQIARRLRIAVRDNPDYARGWLHLGRAHEALGKSARAKSALSKACAGGVTEACSP